MYDFQKFNSIKAIYEDDAQTGLLVLYDGNDTLYDLRIESRQSGGGTNLLFALIEFCFAIRKTEGIKIHKIRGIWFQQIGISIEKFIGRYMINW